MLISAFCFAAMGALSHEVAVHTDWLGVVFARAFTSLIFASAIAVMTSRPFILFSAPKHLWIRSITGTCAMFGAFYAYTHLPIAEAISIANTTPIWMALLVSLVTRESLSAYVWTGVACGTIGVVLVQQPQFEQAGLAIFAGLGGALFSAIAVYNLHLVKKIHPTTIVVHFSMVSSIAYFLALVVSSLATPREMAWTGQVLLGMLGVGILGTVGQLAMTRGYMAGDPAINAIVALAQVAFGVGFDILFWNRSFDLISIVGIVLITSPTVFFAVEQRVAGRRRDMTSPIK